MIANQTDSVEEMHEDGRRKANAKSKNSRKTIIWTLILAAIAALFAIGAYLYINRDRPLVTLNVAAGPYRSDSYEMMKEVADVVSRQSDILRIGLIPTKDSSQNIALLNVGTKKISAETFSGEENGEVRVIEKLALEDKNIETEIISKNNDAAEIKDQTISVDLATIRSDTPVAANVRMVAELFPDYFQIITKHRSNIRKFSDLEGKKIAIPLFGTDEFRSFWAIADHYDVPISAVKWKATPFDKAVNQLLAGEIDALFTVRSLRDRLILNLYEDAVLKSQSLNLIEIELASAISLKRPFLRSETIPKGTYGGGPATPRRDLITAAVTRNLVAKDDVDPELVNELTRILFENRMDLVIRFALSSAIKRPDIDAGTQVPLHDGAEQFYNKDQPSFLQENAEPIALMLTIAAGLFSGLLALRSRLMSGQKNRMDSYNYMLLDIADNARVCNSTKDLVEMKNEHYKILETVVKALDTDEVTEEGFQSFSLLWESVREVLNERSRELA